MDFKIPKKLSYFKVLGRQGSFYSEDFEEYENGILIMIEKNTFINVKTKIKASKVFKNKDNIISQKTKITYCVDCDDIRRPAIFFHTTK